MSKSLSLKCFLVCIAFMLCQSALASNKSSLESNRDGVLEVVIFSTKPNYTSEQIVRKAKLVTPILQSYPGFISRSFSKSMKEKNKWIDVVHWASLHDALIAANEVIKKAQMKEFISVMQNYKMYHSQVSFEVIK